MGHSFTACMKQQRLPARSADQTKHHRARATSPPRHEHLRVTSTGNSMNSQSTGIGPDRRPSTSSTSAPLADRGCSAPDSNWFHCLSEELSRPCEGGRLLGEILMHPTARSSSAAETSTVTPPTPPPRASRGTSRVRCHTLDPCPDQTPPRTPHQPSVLPRQSRCTSATPTRPTLMLSHA